ncbi:MAG: exodeoxyribonuclease V subunit gamma [Firmicutes bacterium]|nr:exodeoxyribonuclease V subunit gamma [Bacillota bacterium]
MNKILENLNQQQKDAVTAKGGPLLVLAGAGSGKTRVITHRIAWILDQGWARPDQILAVTFTNKAAGELKERIKKMLGDINISWVGTFHAIAARILRTELRGLDLPSDFSILSSSDQLSMVKDCFRDLNLDEKKVSPDAVLNTISHAKCQLKDPDAFESIASSLYQKTAATIYRMYEDKLRQQNCMDFDDLITRTVYLFNEHPEILNKYSEKFVHILVDEYQDVNYAQYKLVKLLSESHRNICVVGDDDQSIYGFRGADVSIILRFEKDFDEARIIKLEENYRSTGVILDAANAIAKVNKGRKDKKLWTRQSAGEKLSVNSSMDGREEARYIIREIKARVKDGATLKDFAILYRTNSQSRAMEEILKQEGLDYQIVGGIRFYERKEIKDIISYVKFIINHKDYLSFRRVINTPARGIGTVTQDKIIAESIAQGVDLVRIMKNSHKLDRIGKKIQETLTEFAAMIELLAEEKDKLTPSAFINMVIDVTGYGETLKSQPNAENIERLDNLEELVNDAKEYELTSQDKSIYGFLEKAALFADIDEKENGKDSKGKITMMTLHSAKGLEFPVVCIVGMEEGLLPHFRSINDGKESSMEEERRLFYVGITRATQKLYLTYARERVTQGKVHVQSPSRFLREIPEVLIDKYVPELSKRSFTRKVPSILDKTPAPAVAVAGSFVKGDMVYHKIFGKGEVTDVSKGYITAEFPGVGKKTLSSNFLTPYKGSPELKAGDRIQVEGGKDGILKEISGDFAYVIFDGPTVEKFEKEKVTLKKD